MEETINLVDGTGARIGGIGKLRAHQIGSLHEAFSIFVFNSKGDILLQKRHPAKYHSGGLWTNTCCSHPRQDEDIETAIHRRLREEMGIDCRLQEAFSFVYKVRLDRGLTEHEFDHVFFGVSDDAPRLHPEEASDYRWIGLDDLVRDVSNDPERYTAWLSIIIRERAGDIKDFVRDTIDAYGKNNRTNDRQSRSKDRVGRLEQA
ncbi:MAG TPA: isopentenyl-diphosphate Delta-isomerase [Candidatus Paceibacterota bacterium]|nr:isopentenyl-diphosphate Delta-isomerase [Candidatus Paceibacterota bacterium]